MATARVGWVGFGEAASGIAAGLGGAGVAAMRAYDADPVAAAARARDIGVEMAPSLAALVEWAEVILVATPASAAPAVAADAARGLRRGVLYVDLTTASPAQKAAVARTVEGRGADFVDAAVMDAVPLHGHRVPILAAGGGARRFAEATRPLGMRVEPVDGPPGAAAAIKLVRSIFMKGLAAVLLETLVAAREYGVAEHVTASLRATLTTPFETLAERLVTGTIRHAARRREEIDAALSMQSERDLAALMTLATRAVLARAAGLGGPSLGMQDALASAAGVFRGGATA